MFVSCFWNDVCWPFHIIKFILSKKNSCSNMAFNQLLFSSIPWRMYNVFRECCYVFGSVINWSLSHFSCIENDVTDVLTRMAYRGISFIKVFLIFRFGIDWSTGCLCLCLFFYVIFNKKFWFLKKIYTIFLFVWILLSNTISSVRPNITHLLLN